MSGTSTPLARPPRSFETPCGTKETCAEPGEVDRRVTELWSLTMRSSPQGLLDLFEASQEADWLQLAVAVQAKLDAGLLGCAGRRLFHGEQ